MAAPAPTPVRALRNTDPEWLRDGQGHLWLPYAQMQTASPPLPVISAEGVRIKLADGRELIDGIASWWTACHGYNHPHIRAAVTRQLEAMPHVMLGGLGHAPALTLARRLAAVLPGDLDHVFFSESGSVAVEIAMKMAVQFWLNRGTRGRTRFVCFKYGYHGDTLGAMSVSDPEQGMHGAFAGSLLDQFVVDLPRTAEEIDAFDRFLADRRGEIAAVIMEPLVQGAGGMKFHPPESLAAIRRACDRHDVLLIVDEIFTGFGRTGTLFACEQAAVVPDIMAVSKAMTGGTMALAATIAGARVYDGFLSEDPAHALMHGPTFMGNPLACAAANASLDLFERDPRLAQVAAIESHLREGLEPCRGLAGVVDVRAKGAIGVVQVADLRDLDWLKQRFLEAGIWVRPFEDIIYLTPPFVIGEADLAALTESLVTVIGEWAARRRAAGPA